MTLIKNGTEEITCTPNVDLSQAERDGYAKELLRRMQREHPEQIDEIIQQERQRKQEIEELDKLKQIPTLHAAASLYDTVNNTGAKKLSPLELRRITSRIANSPEYRAAFENYMKNKNGGGGNSSSMVAVVVDAKAASAAENKKPCSSTVKKFYQLQDRIVSGQ